MAGLGFSINMAEVSESVKIPAGTYSAVVGKVELVESSDKTSHNLRWNFDVSAGEFAGTHLSMFTSLKPTALWRLKGVLRNLGFNVDALMNFEVDEDTNIVVSPELVGLPCGLVVVDDEYNGVKRSSVSEVISADAVGEAPAPTKASTTSNKPAVSGLKLR